MPRRMKEATPQASTSTDASEKGKRPRLRVKELLALLRYTKSYKWVYISMFICCAFQMATYQGLSYSLKFLINDIFPLKKEQYLLAFGLGWAGLFSVHALFTVLAAKNRIFLIRHLITNIREAIIKKLQVLSISYFDKRGTGSTSAKLLMDMDKVQQFYDWMFVVLLQAVFGICMSIPLLFSINSKLALIALIYVPVVPILQRIFRAKMVSNSYLLRNTNERLSASIIDFMAGIRHIRMFAVEENQSRSVIVDAQNTRDIDIRYSVVMRTFGMTVQFIGEFTPILLWIAVGFFMIHTNTMTVGSAVAFIALVSHTLGQIGVLFASFDQIVQASPSVTAILGVLDNNEIENQKPAVTSFTIDGNIAIKNVNFSYESRGEQRQLRDISLSIKKGEKVAFVGRSGSGKSTVVNLLLGLYPANEGEVLFGNLEIRSMRLRTLREQIAIMNQETFLFNTSILDNLRFANRNATDEQIIEACKKAEIYDFLVSLPNGLETMAGERGLQLSGGQRQRIGMARVFLRDFKILILDEPSSALDVLTEHTLFETLLRNIEGKTLIIIAHRLSTIKSVDRIYVFDEGRIVEEGTFDHLVKAQGIFSRMAEASSYENK